MDPAQQERIAQCDGLFVDFEDCLGQGTSCVCFAGTWRSPDAPAAKPTPVCVKVSRDPKYSALKREADVLAHLRGVDGVPQLLHIDKDRYEFLVIPQYDVSLADVLAACMGDSSATAVPENLRSRWAHDLIDILSQLHQRNILHCDVKPHNIMLAGGHVTHAWLEQLHLTPPEKRDFGELVKSKIVLVDFNTAEKSVVARRSKKTAERGPTAPTTAATPATPAAKYQRRPMSIDPMYFKGTPNFASLNVHMGIRFSPRDDIESLMYTLAYLEKGRLPWSCLEDADEVEASLQGHEKSEFRVFRTQRKLCLMYKVQTPVHKIGKHSAVHQGILHARSLGFYETPDYASVRSLFATNSD